MRALDVLHALVMEDGRRWGQIAADFQKTDASAIFSPERPHLHFLTRPRGGSKTTDLAGAALAWLAAEAPQRARGVVLASNEQQASLLLDAAAGFIARTPELDGYLTPENERVLAPNGASVRVLPASDAGTWGLLPHLVVLDEFAQWPDTRGSRRVWTAVRSSMQKVPGARLVILTSAGEPSHWSYAILKAALADPVHWRVHEVPGPVPWQDPTEIAALERELLPSEFERLILNRWSEAEDRAIAPDDYEAAAEPAIRFGDAPAGLRGGGWRRHHPHAGRKYLVSVDVGLKVDATVMCVAHLDGDRVVVDHLERWQGSKRHHVQLEDVEQRVAELAREYGAAVHADPDQFQGSLQRLNRAGVKAREFDFNATSVGPLAVALVQAFRSGQIEVPDTPDLRTELLRVKLRSTAPGVVRLDHDRSGHDDQAVAIGLATHLLLGKRGLRSAKDFGALIADGRAETERRRADASRRDESEKHRTARQVGHLVRRGPSFGDTGADTCPHGNTRRCVQRVRRQAS